MFDLFLVPTRIERVESPHTKGVEPTNMNFNGRRSRGSKLSLEPLEPRILLDAINPGQTARLTDGDELYFVQGENDRGDGLFPNDMGGETQEEWVIIASYEGPGSAQLYDNLGGTTLENGEKIGDIDITGATEDSSLRIQRGVFLDDHSLDDIPDPTSPVSPHVRLNRDDSGNYVWWSGGTPWMNTYFEGGANDVSAPEGSGVAVVTGNVHFSENCTGFDTFALDGSLKGSIGYTDFAESHTLDRGETIDQILVGYINGREGSTTGGLDIGGNVNRLLVHTTVGELGAANRTGQTDRFQPAEITVDGYLMEFQSSGTIFADITVDGFTDPVDVTYDDDPGGPFYGSDVVEGAAGIISDDEGGAYIVGSPSGNFTIEGEVWEHNASYRNDLQDWYAFTPGLGREITVEMRARGPFESIVYPTWVAAPSGRIVGVVEEDAPVTFTADEAGTYHLIVGETPSGQEPRMMDVGLWSMEYEVSVTGAKPVQVGGIIAGSNHLTNGNTGDGLELGDDVSSSWIRGNADFGVINVRGDGGFGDINMDVFGDVGHLTAAETDTFIGGLDIDISGNLGKFESRSGALSFNTLFVDGDIGELSSAGDLSDNGLVAFADIGGHVGSVFAQGLYRVDMDVESEGIDFFYVGGDFGMPVVGGSHARLDMGTGADVGFAHVVGDIYDQGDEVQPVSVTDETVRFVDDGGSTVVLKPVATRTRIVPDGLQEEYQRVAPSIEYRFLPVGRTDGGGAGAVLTEITASDSLEIVIEGGSAELPLINLGTSITQPDDDDDGDDEDQEEVGSVYRSAPTKITMKGQDPLAELDVWRIDSGVANIPLIANYTHQGDILNLNVGSVGRIHANGNIGVTDRLATGNGRMPNPDPAAFSPAAVPFVTETEADYFNGVIAAGSIGRITARGSIGDVYVSEGIQQLIADFDNEPNNPAFSFRGFSQGARTWDGLAGVVHTVGSIDYIDPGSGLYGGQGAVPIGGIFAEGSIGRLNASDSTIQGPVMAMGEALLTIPGEGDDDEAITISVFPGIQRMTGFNTEISDTVIGAGAEFSDWALWDEIRGTVEGVRVNNLTLRGPQSGIDGVRMQVGVLNNLYFGPQTQGLSDSYIHAMGDPDTDEGINRITVLGGGMDGTGTPLYHPVLPWDINARENIRSITLGGPDVDMVDMDIRALKEMRSIRVQGDIVANTTSEINAPLGIRQISANNYRGPGLLDIGTGQLHRILARGDFDAQASVDGPVTLLSVGKSLSGSFTTVGSNGQIQRVVVGGDMPGSVETAGRLGTLSVMGGDLSGRVIAGGSNQNNQAIGTVFVRNGDLGTVGVTPDTQALRPGGGIGSVVVNGSVQGGIFATSFYDTGRANAVTADIGLIKVMGGDIDGGISISREDASDPNDPGGVLHNLVLSGGDLNGDMNLAGGAGLIQVAQGTVSGEIDVVTGDVRRIVIAANGTPAISNDISVGAGDLGLLKVVGGDFVGDLRVGQELGTLYLTSKSDMIGEVNSGDIVTAYFMGPNGITKPLTATGHAGTIRTPNGTSPAGTIDIGAGLDRLISNSRVQGDVTVNGDVGTLRVSSESLEGNLQVNNGNVDRIVVPHGQLGGGSLTETGIDVTDGDIGLLWIDNAPAAAVANEINVSGRVDRAYISGNVDSDIVVGSDAVGDGAGLFRVVGNVGTAGSGQGDINIRGDVENMNILSGRVTGNGASDERVHISGNVQSMRVTGFTGGGSVVDDNIVVGDRLNQFVINGGRFDGVLEAGTMGTVLYNTPNGIVNGVNSRGDLELLRTSGPITGNVNVDHFAEQIRALQGVSETGTISVGDGAPGDGLGTLSVRGDMRGAVTVQGDLVRVSIIGNLGVRDSGASVASIDVEDGNLDELTVQGDIIESSVTALDGKLSNAFVHRGFTESTIDAGELGRVVIRGTLSGSGNDDEIHAGVGEFDLLAAGQLSRIKPGASKTINGVLASVGTTP